MLWKFIKDHLQGFWSGVVGGGIVWSIVLFPAKIFLSSVVLAFVGKFMMVAGLAMITGFFKVLGEDILKKNSHHLWRVWYRVKDFFKKPKNKKDERTGLNGQEKRA